MEGRTGQGVDWHRRGQEQVLWCRRSHGSTKNSITYIEWSYAKDNNLKMAQLDSGNGPVEPTADSVAKAVGEAKVKGSGNDLEP